MNRNLSEPLFHGTASTIAVGKRVVPSSKGGQSSNWAGNANERGQRPDEHAFATTGEQHAWHFATMAAHNPAGAYGQRPRVYTVAPHAKQKPGAYAADFGEVIAPSFKVTGQHDIMPGQQGTLAGHGAEPFNWTPFHLNYDPGDANHPKVQPENLAKNNRLRETQQTAYLDKLREGTPQSEGQMELPMHVPGGTQEQQERAAHHLLSHAVARGAAPATQLDRQLHEDQSLDAFNRRRGRRSNFAKRDR